MDFSFDLSLVDSQKILLTPQVKQELDVLRKSSQELYKYVEEQMENNPVLELAEDERYIDDNFYIDMDDETELGEATSANTIIEEQSLYNNEYMYIHPRLMPKSMLSLKEHLILQLHISNLEENQISIGEYLINNIDENGYLTVGLPEVAKYFNVSISKVNKVLKHVQNFDPPGVCARDLKECLLIQLKQKNIKDKNIINIIENHMNDLAAGDIDKVAEKTGLKRTTVEEIFDYIKTLEPKPGREFFETCNADYIIPDVIVKKSKTKLEVHINEDSIPLLNINEYYGRILASDVSNDVKNFIKTRLDSAKWLIKCIDQRKEVIKKVADSIVSKQSEFFHRGREFLKPLSAKEIAEDVDMHESIVSSIVNGKYIQCVWGIFEMRYFINS